MYRLPSSPSNRVDLTKNISLHLPAQPEESLETYFVLPEYLDKLIDQPWNSDANRQLDWWLWYIEQEFEMAGGTV